MAAARTGEPASVCPSGFVVEPSTNHVGNRIFREAPAGKAGGEPPGGCVRGEMAETSHGDCSGLAGIGVFIPTRAEILDDLFDDA
jgi:hypothetical protein